MQREVRYPETISFKAEAGTRAALRKRLPGVPEAQVLRMIVKDWLAGRAAEPQPKEPPK